MSSSSYAARREGYRSASPARVQQPQSVMAVPAVAVPADAVLATPAPAPGPEPAPAAGAAPGGNKQFTQSEAEELLKGSTGGHIAGYVSFIVSIATLVLNLHLMDSDDGGSEAGDGGTGCLFDLGDKQKLYVACVHCRPCHFAGLLPARDSVPTAVDELVLLLLLVCLSICSTACTFATGQIIPLAKITRDRFVASLHDMDGAPTGLKFLSGTTEAYITALVFFIISIGFCFHSIADISTETDQTISLVLSLFFLVCSASWVCKTTRDRSDVSNKLWEGDDARVTIPVILRLARGTGTNVILCVTAWVSSVLLTLICIWKSTNENFDSTIKLLLSMGEIFQILSAFWLAKTVRDSAIPGEVTTSIWMLSTGGLLCALALTYIGLFTKWNDLGSSLALTLWTALSFSLFSTFFLVSPPLPWVHSGGAS
eukprot:SAG11_NODE_3310_length_2531_cov_4.143092_1_plen_427_part_00